MDAYSSPMNRHAQLISAAAAAVLVSALVAGSFATAKSYAQNPIQDLAGNVTNAGNNLIGNLTGSGNQTSSGNQTTATGNVTGSAAGNQTTTTTTTTTTNATGNQTTSATGNMTGSAAGNQTGTPKQADRLTGRISSIQVEDGKPAWIQAGIWLLKIGPAAPTANATSPTGNATSTTTTTATGNATTPAAGNATITTTTNTTIASPTANGTGAVPMLDFIARFDMVKLDGSAMHQHNVTDLKASTFTFENGTYTINGTATVTMRDGPVQDVPVAIKIMKDSVIAMTIGPDKVDKHFGTDPIYGTVARER